MCDCQCNLSLKSSLVILTCACSHNYLPVGAGSLKRGIRRVGLHLWFGFQFPLTESAGDGGHCVFK